MMAAASPRVLLFLRAFRAQDLKAPLWARGRGMAIKATAATPMSPMEQQGPLMGQESTLMGQESTLMGQKTPLMGQEAPLMGQGTPLMGQEAPLMGQKNSLMGQESTLMGQEGAVMGQPHGCVGLAEARLEDLGLGSLTPVGLIQNLLQFLHLDVGLPWWGAIAAGTLCVRVALLPLLLKAQREAARTAPHLPHIQRLAQRLQDAKRGADPQQVFPAPYNRSCWRIKQKHNVNPLRGFLVPIVQTPIFISFFLALQQMAALPVPGFQHGGAGWINDLSCPDPTYALPLLSSATMWMVLEAGVESGVSSPQAGAVRVVLRLLPLLFLPMTIHFPAAIFVYWLTSNSFSLLQALLLRVPVVRSALRIPALPHNPPMEPNGAGPKEGILQRMRNSLAEARAAQNADRREWQRRNHLKMAAKGPLRQTFAQNPLAPPVAPEPPPAPKRPWKETLG
ncbi:mitochondrial inner membrane protein OXA1L [Coturnix japonica]|uniref:mitochondrial inner membrane protein OXA1L n=1 Tax=Coturnix japonica TaxID=93934 RepID=UPI000777D895|nr:mitochondrial inner membrane protein OXA1L [Coturnix japonica]